MKVLVGVCGGIAAYKAAELVRSLQQRGAEVEVAMTASAQQFVTPLTFASLTGRAVHTSLWVPDGKDNAQSTFEIEHISVAQRADVMVIAPATANTLAKLAHGLADDFVSTAALAMHGPIVVAPAMNVVMWDHPATQENVRILRERGVHIVEPGSGYLACGMTGSGRLAEVETIADAVMQVAEQGSDLAGETILVTAGGTREALDAVRFLGNRSSGKMGHAVAEAAAARGANVVLVTASSLPAAGCRIVRVETAEQMRAAVLKELDAATVVIKAAAVADFRPKQVAEGKMRRQGNLVLELEPTEDIVAEVARRRRPGTLVIAFAAEAENLEVRGREKLFRKGVDAVVANDISEEGLGFDSDRNGGLFLTEDGTLVLEPAAKRQMAGRILDQVAALRARVLVHSR